MRILQTFFGPFDLDDPKTYDALPKTVKKLDKLMFKEIGYALCYMDHFHPDWFDVTNTQRLRVNTLIAEFCRERHNHYKENLRNRLWMKEQVFVFQMETENMC